MAEEFEGRDLAEAVFWGCDLRRAHFRYVDLTGARVVQSRIVDLDVDGLVERVTINGVDVTDYVNERDPWFPLRSQIRPTDPAGLRAGWAALEREWDTTIAEAGALSDSQRHASVGGEWSFVQTLRHLVFATDKWFSVPILGDGSFNPIGVPNSGSVDFGWPGLDVDADPTFDEVLAVRRRQAERLREYLERVTPDDLGTVVEVLENGPNPVLECLHTVLEEEFEHLRYARRDLAQLG